MIPITAKVQNQGGDKTVQPSSNSSVNAEGTRLRRRLSKIFHRDSPESGFFWRRLPGPGTRDSQPTTQSANPRESSGAGGSRPRCSEMDIPRTTCTSLNSPARA